jgi:hypothetical protein
VRFTLYIARNLDRSGSLCNTKGTTSRLSSRLHCGIGLCPEILEPLAAPKYAHKTIIKRDGLAYSKRLCNMRVAHFSRIAIALRQVPLSAFNNRLNIG